MKRLHLACLLPLVLRVAAGQSITNVVNGASNLPQGLPGSGIAQGAIFIVYGSGLGPTPAATDTNPFQSTTLGNTSVSVTVGSSTVNALMWYASDGQVNALLPSSAPTGSGTLTVTYNGNSSAAYAITVSSNSFGIVTLSGTGQGVAVVTQPDYSIVSSVPGAGSLGGGGPYTYSGAANPGDTLTIWGTGLGPVSGSDASGSGLGVNMPGVNAQVWLGGVAVTPSYQGRSGCCVGEDQIVFTVPGNAPTGCAVPLAVQIGNAVSNFGALAVASSGRSCIAANPALASPSAIQALTASSGPINYASLQLGRSIAAASSSGIQYEDFGLAEFAQIEVSAANQPVVISSLDGPPMGTCSTSNSNAPSATALFSVVTGIDAGKITVSGPQGSITMQERQETVGPTNYGAVFSSQGLFFTGGNYTVTGAGGNVVGKFTNHFSITSPAPTWQSSDQARLLMKPIARGAGMTLNWTGGSDAYSVMINIAASAAGSSTPSNSAPAVGASITCVAPSAPGSFTIPASVMLTLPAQSGGEIDFKPALPLESIQASSLDVGSLSFEYQTSIFPTFN